MEEILWQLINLADGTQAAVDGNARSDERVKSPNINYQDACSRDLLMNEPSMLFCWDLLVMVLTAPSINSLSDRSAVGATRCLANKHV